MTHHDFHTLIDRTSPEGDGFQRMHLATPRVAVAAALERLLRVHR